jgi:pimeloyl-ACP methyl ester carboxylesterase
MATRNGLSRRRPIGRPHLIARRRGVPSALPFAGGRGGIGRRVLLGMSGGALSAMARPTAALAQESQSPPPTRASANLWYGQVPNNAGTQPVLLFVHGLGGIAEDWWTDESPQSPRQNDMYALAYQRAYRTAFVSLSETGTRGEEQHDPYEHAPRLAGLIETVCQHYGVGTLAIVAHSKGGVDAQAAIALEGAAPRVSAVVTLSAPHFGTALADFAAANPELVELVGFTVDEALRSMQSSFMAGFRDQVDPVITAPDHPVAYWVAGGTDWGDSLFTRITGRSLSRAGPNDSFVPVSSATGVGADGVRRPWARLLFVQPFHHFSINLGSNSFPWIDAVLRRELGS